MLDKLKKYASGWVAQLLLALLVLSFAVWGVSDIFTGFRSNDIARVGSSDITILDFQRSYQAAVRAVGAQLGRALTPDQAQQLGVPQQLLGRLVNEATLNNAARDLGLGISSETLSRMLATDPNLVGPGGKFDRNALVVSIRNQGWTPDDFVLDRRAEYVRNQIAQAFVGGLAAPDAYLRAIHEYRNEKRAISYVVLSAPPVSDIAEPGNGDLSAYFDAHKADWKAPEFRAISYFVLSPETLAHSDEVSDDDAKQRYDSQTARFKTAEKRKVEQIIFPNRAEADQAAAALTAGKTFDQLVAERNLKPADIDLGLVTREGIADPNIAEAAFKLAQGTVSPVIDGGFGPAIIRVATVEPEKVVPFEEAKADLKKEIAGERAAAEVSDVYDAIEDARAGGTTLAEVAAKYGLKLATIPTIDAAGRDADGKDIADVPGGGMLKAAFETGVGIDNSPVQPDSNSFVWFEVTASTAARDRTLDEVRDKVVAAWKNSERSKRLIAKADEIKGRLDAGEDIAKVAGELALEVKPAADLTRDSKTSGDLSSAAISAAFDGPKGTVAVADGAAAMTRIVLVVTDTVVPAYVAGTPELAKTRQQLDGQIVGDLLGLYVAELQSKIDVRFNQAALQQALGVSAN